MGGGGGVSEISFQGGDCPLPPPPPPPPPVDVTGRELLYLGGLYSLPLRLYRVLYQEVDSGGRPTTLSNALRWLKMLCIQVMIVV